MLCEDPCQGNLSGGSPVLRGDLLELVDEFDVLGEVLLREPRDVEAEIIPGEVSARAVSMHKPVSRAPS